jgi:hypothetical protein
MTTFFPRLSALLPGLLFAGAGAFAQGVGIGTTTPTAKLDVNGDFKVANISPATAGKIEQTQLRGTGSTNRIGQSFTLAAGATLTSIGFHHHSTSNLNGTLRIYAGAGTSSTPLYSQAVLVPGGPSGGTLFTAALSSPLTVAAGVYTFQFEFGSSCLFALVSADPYPGGRQFSAGYDSAADYDLRFEVGYNTSSNVQTLFASGTGNVGIGTTSPSQRLEVAGNVLVSGSGNGIVFPDGSKQTTSAGMPNLATAAPLSGNGTTGSPLTVPTASASQAGVLSAADYSAFSNKFTLPSLSSGSVVFSNGTTLSQNNGRLFWDNAGSRLGVGTAAPGSTLAVNGDFSVANVSGGSTGQLTQTVDNVFAASSQVGQSFSLPTSAALTSVSFHPSNASAVSGTLRILQGNGRSGTQLHSQPVTVPTGASALFTAVLTAPLQLAAGTYTFVFDFGSVESGFLMADGNPYAGGQLQARDYDGYAQLDLKFTVSYSVGGSNVQTLYASSSGNVGIGTTSPAFKLDVNGAIRCVGAVNTTSDARLKQQIRPITGALARVQALRGVRYTFRQQEYPALHLPDGEQIGVLAQEVEAIFPELVSTDAQGYKAVNYAQLTPVLIEALKEQQRQLERQQQQIEQLQQQGSAQQADHADLLTLKQQLARLLSQQPTAANLPARP